MTLFQCPVCGLKERHLFIRNPNHCNTMMIQVVSHDSYSYDSSDYSQNNHSNHSPLDTSGSYFGSFFGSDGGSDGGGDGGGGE